MRHWEHQGMAKWFESWPNMYEMKPRMIFIKHIHKTQWWVDTNNDELTPSCSLKESSLTPLRRFASQGHHTSVLAQAHSDASRTVQYEGAILGWPYLTLVGWGLTNLSNFVARPLPSRWYHCVFIDKNSPRPQGWLAGHRLRADISCGTSLIDWTFTISKHHKQASVSWQIQVQGLETWRNKNYTGVMECHILKCSAFCWGEYPNWINIGS